MPTPPHPLAEGAPSRRRYDAFLAAWRDGDPQRPPARTGAGIPYRQLFGWLRPWRHLLAIELILGLLVAGGAAVWPVTMGWIVDVVAPGQHPPPLGILAGVAPATALAILAGATIAVAVLTQVLEVVRLQVWMQVTSGFAMRLRKRLFDRILRLPLATLHQHKAGGLVARINRDADGAGNLITNALLQPAAAAIRLAIVAGVVVWIDARVAALGAAVVAAMAWMHYLHVQRFRPAYRAIHQERDRIAGRAAEVVAGMPIVRGFAREPHESLLHALGQHAAWRMDLFTTFRMYRISGAWRLLSVLLPVLVFALGGWFVLRGELRIGEVITLQVLIGQALDPIMRLVDSMTQLQRGLASFDQVEETLALPPEPADAADALPAPADPQRIAFADLWFAYRGEDWVLAGVSFAIARGQTVALVGRSGAGKSTIAGLLLRFHDPQRGAVLVDGCDLRGYRRADWRSRLALVSQDVVLFDGTIADNIAYGRRGADRAAIEAAARQANAWEFIAGLERGLDTPIGERGVRLSGGQRQRISIARALLADPALLILDEATSSLDSHSEALIQESLERLKAGRTAVVIAHRLATVRRADAIVVLDRGRVVETGTHDELVAKGPGHPYADLVARQELGEAEPTPT